MARGGVQGQEPQGRPTEGRQRVPEEPALLESSLLGLGTLGQCLPLRLGGH